MADPLNKFDPEQLLRLAHEVRTFEKDLAAASGSRLTWRWIAPLAAAAALALAATAWILSGSDRTPPRRGILPPIALANPERTVNMVVALYRGDKRVNDRCAECWCVARWDADWGDGRTVNELEHDELVSGSVARSCVGDPRRVVVIGLSGPASAMPRTDQQALDLSLCLMGEVDPVADTPGATACVPKGLDYCMADWVR